MKKIVLSGILMSALSFAANLYAETYINMWAGVSNPDAEQLGSSSGIGGAIGYQFGKYFALEASKKNLGTFDGKLNSDLSVDVYEVGVVGLLPILDNFGLHLRAGEFYWETDVSGAAIEDIQSVNDFGDDIYYGVGIWLSAEDQGMIKLEYSEHNINSVKIGSVGAVFEIHF